MDMKDIMKPVTSQSFLIGMGVAGLAYVIGPQLMQSLKPIAVKGVEGIMTLGIKTKDAFDDMICSNNSEPQKTSDANNVDVFTMILKELKEEKEASNKILDELKGSIICMKEEISNLRGTHTIQES